jgi:peptide deformylase
MILPITAYGHPVLKKVAQDIDNDYPELEQFIRDMFETMYFAEGVGLAAPQVNKSIRVFVMDASHYADEIPEAKDFKKVFINAHIIERTGDEKLVEEGCLSIPHIREEVWRKNDIRIEYYDENWQFHTETYSGMIARIIQHEYDHLDGILFVDKVSMLRKTLLKRKLQDITTGNIKTDYKMIFPPLKKKRITNLK